MQLYKGYNESNPISSICGFRLEALVDITNDKIVGYEVLSSLCNGIAPEVWFPKQKPSLLISVLMMQMAQVNQFRGNDSQEYFFNINTEGLLRLKEKDILYFSQFGHYTLEIADSWKIKYLTKETRQLLFQKVDCLRDYGIPVWVDDFTCADLISLDDYAQHIDGVKLDRSELHSAWLEKQLDMIRKTLGDIPLLCEGIESEEDLDEVKALSINLAQGYFWGNRAIAIR